MAFINEETKEINCKVVYYGPPQCGKSTTLRAIFDSVKKESKGDIISLNRGAERTLYFDFVPLTLGKYKGYTIRLHLYTVPGEIGYQASRELTSKGLDGVVFIADSRLECAEANLASFRSLREILVKEGHDPARVPMVFQYNKRDLPNVVPTKELSNLLNKNVMQEFETVATKAQGVFEALKAIGTKVLVSLKENR